MSKRLAATLFAVGLGAIGALAAPSPKLWGGLKPGPYAVGFRTEWRYDWTRRYAREGFSVFPARPILVNTWYPSEKSSPTRLVRHRDYLDLAVRKAPAAFPKGFATALAQYEFDVMAQEMLGKKRGEFTDAERKEWIGLLNAETQARLEAPPFRNRRFPVVVYHAGAGSSFEDNAVLLEHLASQGYVVLGSAFLKGDGKSFNIDGTDDSIRDIDFLSGLAAALPNGEAGNFAVLGHSAGAQAAMMYAARPNVAARAIVALDTTQDYYNIQDPRWSTLLPFLKANGKHFHTPLLAAAQPNAYFQLCDTLSSSNRTYFTYTSFDHNNFIAQGILGTEMKRRLEGTKPPSEETKNLARARRCFQMLAEVVRAYLDFHLKGVPFRPAAERAFVFDARLDFAAVGATGPKPYDPASGRPPTPREFRALIDRSLDDAANLLTRLSKVEPDSPLFDFTYVTSILFELVKLGRTTDAKRLSEAFECERREVFKNYVTVGEFFAKMGRNEYALGVAKTILAIRPDWPGAKALLEKIEGKKGH